MYGSERENSRGSWNSQDWRLGRRQVDGERTWAEPKGPWNTHQRTDHMPVWKSLSEGETSNPQDYQEEFGGLHRPGKRASSQYPDWKSTCFVCMKWPTQGVEPHTCGIITPRWKPSWKISNKVQGPEDQCLSWERHLRKTNIRTARNSQGTSHKFGLQEKFISHVQKKHLSKRKKNTELINPVLELKLKIVSQMLTCKRLL